MDRKPSSAPLYTGDDTQSLHDEVINGDGTESKQDEERYMAKNCAGCLVASLCIAMLFLIIAAIGLCIWLFLFLPMDGKPDHELVVVKIDVTLDRQYTSDYEDPSSTLYRNLERDYITTMGNVLGRNIKFEDSYVETTVSQIRYGSVIIISWVVFNSSIGDSFDIPDELRQEIIKTLSEETNDGRLGGLHGNVIGFRVSHAIDPEDQPTWAPPATHDPQPPPTRDPRPPPTREPPPPRTEPPRPTDCELNAYRCAYATLYCIGNNLVCNGHDDCPYGDDEQSCPNEYCELNEYTCDYTSLYCIADNLVCDGQIDCPYDDDEEHCPGEYCELNEYTCEYTSLNCIADNLVCDGQIDCPYGDDEEHCPDEYCELDKYKCEYATLYCIANSLLCNGEIDCPYSDDEEHCLDDCGEDYINLNPGDSYELTSVNYPNQYSDDSFCQWAIETVPGRQLLLQFSEFSLEYGFDYLYIGLDGKHEISGASVVNFTGSNLPHDLLSKGSIVVITMVTDDSSRDRGFVLRISDTDGSGLSACEDGGVIPSDSICDNNVDCPDNSDEAPCQCGDVSSDIALHDPFDIIHLTSINYPDGHYTNSLNCFWTVTAALGYRVFVHFNVFSLQPDKDFLTISGGHYYYPFVSYNGSVLPPDIESPYDFLYIWFETDSAIGDSGFYLTITQTQPLGRTKCDNDLELYPDSASSGLCDGIPHCFDNSDEPEGCECGQDEYHLVPGGEPVNLVSANYPLEYRDATSCRYTITTYQGYRILARFLKLDLEDGVDFIFIDAGDAVGRELSYTGTITPDRRPLDIISIGNTITINFQTDDSNAKTGFQLQLTSQSGYSDDLLLCDNGVQFLPEEYVCDNMYDCGDYSDENGCVDILGTEICGTRPAVDPRRILNGRDASVGEMPWLGQLTLNGIDAFCGATLLNEFWAATAAHCVADVIDPIYLVFGDLATRDRAPSTSNRQVVEAALIFTHPTYVTGFLGSDIISGDITLIRFKEPVKYSDYVRPACVSASTDEPNEYQQCRVAGWGLKDDADSPTYVKPSWLQIATVPILPAEECIEDWRTDGSSGLGFENDDWFFAEGNFLCGGIHETEEDTGFCDGDSGSSLVCKGDDNRWHLVGIVSFGTHDCRRRPGVYTRVSSYRHDILNFVHDTESCLSSRHTDCLETIGCTGGSLCPMPECGVGEFRCRTGKCIPREKTCDKKTDCYDNSDEALPMCYDDCGTDDIYLSNGVPYTLTSPHHPSPYPTDTSCQWVVTAPPGNRIFAQFNLFDLEEDYDFLYIGYEPAAFPIGYPSNIEYPVYAYSGSQLPPSFLSPRNNLFVTMTSDQSETLFGFSINVHVYGSEDLPPLCGDNFQVFAGESAECNGFQDCVDNSDEAACDVTECPSYQALQVEPESSISLTSPHYPDYYTGSLSCRWIVGVRPDRYILVKILSIDLDIETDALQVSSVTGIEGVFTYSKDQNDYKKFADLYFHTSEVVVHFQSDPFWSRHSGFSIMVYETNGDDCIASTDPSCAQRPECNEDCYKKSCGNGIEVYPESWFCDGHADCKDENDEPEFCECGERDIQLPSGSVYELSSPVSVLYPSTYRQSSNCQWVITTSPGYVLFAHFTTFDVEDRRDYVAHDGDLYGDYLYAGTGTNTQTYRRVVYTGSDIPLDLETPENTLVLTFVTDDSIAYDGFAVTIWSRQPQALSELKCANGLQLLRGDLLCNGNPDCYGPPSDEEGCGAP